MDAAQLLDISSWPSFSYVFPYAVAAWQMGVFFASLSTSASHTLLEQVGFPQPRDKPLHYFWTMFAVKELMSGVIFLLLSWAGEWKAVSIVLAVSCGGGMMDTIMAATKGGVGWIEAFKAHGVVTAVGIYVAYQLWLDNK
jgi:hypothetical protein